MPLFCNPIIVVICCAIAAFDGLYIFEISQGFIYVNLEKMATLFQGTVIQSDIENNIRSNQQ